MDESVELYLLILRLGHGSFSLGFQANDLDSALEFAKRWVQEMPMPRNAVLVVKPPTGAEIEVSMFD